jgi:iron complex outermembrane recepter protein
MWRRTWLPLGSRVGLAIDLPNAVSPHESARNRTVAILTEFRLAKLATLVAVLLAACPAAAQPAAQDAPTAQPPLVTLPPVVVIGTTPLPALGIPVEKYAGNVQSLTADDIKSRSSVDLPDALFRRLGSVNITGGQGNPWQNDVTYRGFLASPLTGSAIGLSVYLDGMRFNDGFGDTVSWDLIPKLAISGIDVIPGSNPIFGLNTLGGALAVRTKNGRDFPGTSLGVSAGSFGRWNVEAEHGGSHGPFDWYGAFNALNEDGWRDRSPSELRQLFTKVGWQAAGTSVGLSYIFINNDLVGNGLVPESTLARKRSAVHTFPDQTRNQMHLGSVSSSHQLTEDLLLSGNAFYREYWRRTFNGDAEVTCVDDATGEEVFDASGRLLHLGRCGGSSAGFFDGAGNPLAGTLQREAAGEDRTTHTRSQDWGATLQLAHKGKVFGHGNRVTGGVAYDGHQSRFNQREAEADLVPKGASVGTRRTGGFETAVDVHTQQDNVGVYATDTFDITERLALTLAGRYQHVSITIRDRSGQNPALDGEHQFSRFSPAAGLTLQVLKDLTLFASYSEGFRAPTPAELTCADPNAPCNLPNAFVADPPLRPVVARTYEVGARGRLPILGNPAALAWSVGLFRTDLEDDILFTITETGGGGFFRNVSGTRRQGVEVGLSGEWKRLRYFLSYAFVDATYRSRETLASVTEADGVRIQSGDRIPGIPQHNLKLGAEAEVLKNLWIGADVIATSGTFLRGDDGNRRGKVDGYGLLNLHARYQLFQHVELWARVDNATDAHYATGGALNFNAFGNPIAVERFVAPGAPIGGWGGVRVTF